MSKPIATNRKAYRDFAFTETWECGIALNGGEVKSIRQGGVNFKDSYARVEKKEIFLHNLHIDPYAHAGIQSLDPVRKRKLLLHKREIRKLIELAAQKRLILVPTKLYFNKGGFVKLELAAGRGKKLYDKREDIKRRDIDRSLKRVVKSYRKKV